MLELAEEVGRDPATVESSACLYVSLDPNTRERPLQQLEPVGPGMTRVAEALAELATGGADEAILVVNPITEASITALGEALAILDA